jgi:hypothetical protein
VLAASDTGTAIREWIVGVGPVIAAVVARYLGVWRERWRRPRLELHLDKSSDQDLVTLTTPRSHWARLRVSNRRRKRSAEGVEVLVTRFRPLDDEPSPAPIDTLPLRWSSLPEPTTSVDLPPGVERHSGGHSAHRCPSARAPRSLGVWDVRGPAPRRVDGAPLV